VNLLVSCFHKCDSFFKTEQKYCTYFFICMPENTKSGLGWSAKRRKTAKIY